MRGKLILTGMLFMGSTILSDGSIAYAIDSSNTSIEEVQTIDENVSPTGEVKSSTDNLIIGEENTSPISKENTLASVQTSTSISLENPSVTYTTHVQDYGWLASVSDGKMSGTQGQAKRLEAIKISLKNLPYSGGISYKTHVQDYGWLSNVSDGALSGTSGQSKRLEAIQINLTGEMAKHYDIYYRVHAETYGWLDWAKNGESAGTQGLSKRLEAIEIVLVEKGGAAPGSTNKPLVINQAVDRSPHVNYSTHVQDYGWLANVSDGKMSGTEGQAKRSGSHKDFIR